MLKMNHDLAGALEEYLKLMDEEEYFEAHEVLEEAWHPLRLGDHPLALLAKGLINGAIGFEHIKRDRKNAGKKALRVMESYERYKDMCIEGIEHYGLFNQAVQKVESLKRTHNSVFSRV